MESATLGATLHQKRLLVVVCAVAAAAGILVLVTFGLVLVHKWAVQSASTPVAVALLAANVVWDVSVSAAMVWLIRDALRSA